MIGQFEESELFASISTRVEDNLLLLCGRTTVCEETASRIKTLAAEDVDWEYLYLLAKRHAVLPLLHRQLNANARQNLPEAFRLKLSEKYRENATRNILLAGELTGIVKLFEKEGISSLAYKGPALAVSAYGDIALRRFIDLDIIVRKHDVRRAGEVLKRLGFTLSGDLTESQLELLLRTQHNLAFVREGGKLIIEIHWEIASERFASIAISEQIWARSVPIILNGVIVRSLSPEDLLLALCVHGTKHLWERLAWICDLAQIINSQNQLDWDYVVKKAKQDQMERMLYLGLRLACILFTAQIPVHVRKSIFEDVSATRLYSTVVAKLFKGENFEPAGLVESVAFNIRARRRLREKIRYFRFIFNPTDGDLNAIWLPPGLMFIYYLLRPLRLFMKGTAGH